MGNNGVYQARLRIVTVTDDDFRNFTLRLNNGKTQIDHVVVLNKTPQGKISYYEIKILIKRCNKNILFYF